MAYPTGFKKTRAGTLSAHPGYVCRWGENGRGEMTLGQIGKVGISYWFQHSMGDETTPNLQTHFSKTSGKKLLAQVL
jgi:hypothetical protein